MTHVSVRQGLLYVTLAATMWGTGGAAGALLHRTGGLGPVAATFWRFALGALLLAAVRPLLTAGRPLPAGRRPAPLRQVLATGIALATTQAAYFAAIAESGVAVATVLTLGVTPLLVALGARVTLGERLGRAGTAGVAASLAGLAMLALGAGPAGLSPAGAGWALLSAVAYAWVTTTGRAAPGDPLGTTLGALAAGGVVLLPLALAEGVLPSAADPAGSAALIVYLAGVPTALAYGLFFAGLAAVRATTASVVVLLEPVGATLIGVFALGERLSPLSAAGAAVLLLAVAALAVTERR